jgi:hypothetical protein
VGRKMKYMKNKEIYMETQLLKELMTKNIKRL